MKPLYHQNKRTIKLETEVSRSELSKKFLIKLELIDVVVKKNYKFVYSVGCILNILLQMLLFVHTEGNKTSRTIVVK